MKKGFVVVVVLVAVVGLAWFGWQFNKSIPKDQPYSTKSGEAISQSDNARGEVAKTEVKRPKPQVVREVVFSSAPAVRQPEIPRQVQPPVSKTTGTLVIEGELYKD